MSDFDDSLLEEAEQFDEMYREFNQEEGLWGGVEEDFYEEAEQGENDHIQKEESSRVAPLAPPAAGDLAPYTASHEKVHGWQKDYMQCDDDDDDDDDNGVNMGYDRRQLIAKLAARSREKRNFSALGSVAVMSEVKMATFCGHLKRNKGPNDDQAGVFERTASSAPSFPPEALLLPPEDSECVTWTLKSGRRLFFRKITREYKGPGRTAFSLLDKPFSDVERQADELAIRKVRETERQILSHPLAGNPHQQNDLWVDKYSPKAFPSLLSDERINRGVLRALKEWDPFVFGKKLPAAESGKGLQCKSSSLKMYMGAKGGAGTGTDPASTDSSRDPNDLRPECKVIMLCGPPGLGKTTLAHIVAQQAGYRPLEINASDDRSAPVLRQRVTLAMESRSLFGERRPNCIILDEVDGADGMLAINALVSICNAPLRHKAGKAGKGKGRRGTDPPLTRPLILICNNQYAPALRPIRSIARIFTFRHTAPQRLVSRLQAVCHCEKITVRPEALKKLCDKSGTDIRSCLNALQSLSLQLGSSSRKVDATAAVLSEVESNGKDERSDVMQILDSVFSRPLSKAAFRDTAKCVWDRTHDSGDHGRIMDGIHENLLTIRFSDTSLGRTSRALDWLTFADIMSMRNKSYVPAVSLGVHLLCASETRQKIVWPKAGAAYVHKHEQQLGILRGFVDAGRQQRMGGGADVEVAACQLLSPLVRIIAPNIRPVNPDLLAPAEHARFRALVGVLSACGLTFTASPARTEGYGQGTDLQLDPPIDILVSFGEDTVAHRHLPRALRSFAAQEARLEAIRMSEGLGTESKGQHGKGVNEPPAESATSSERPDSKKRCLDMLEDEAVAPSAAIPFWVLGRSAGKSSRAAKELKVQKEGRLRYKFQAGYTNAIRRPVLMSDLL